MATSTRRLLLTWLPTSVGSAMLVIEIPLVYAAAARSDQGAGALATMGVTMSVLTIVNAPALALTPLVVAEDGRDIRRYVVAVGLVGSAVLLALGGLPPLADVASAVAGGHAAHLPAALVAIAPNSLAVALRRHLHGRLITAQRTRPIAVATALRIAGSGTLAFVGVATIDLPGAVVGAAALSAGAFIEAGLLAIAVRRLGPAPSHRRPGLLRRHVHLTTTRLVAAVPFAITMAGIAHAAHPATSLVVWPALLELAMLFASPTSDWESVAAVAMARERHDRAPRRLTLWLTVGFVGAFTLTLVGGLGRLYLDAFLSVPADATDLGLTWAPLMLSVPALWLARGYLRAIAISTGATSRLGVAGVVHVVVLAVCLLALVEMDVPGVGAAALALNAGLVAEVAATGWFASTPPRLAVLRNLGRPVGETYTLRSTAVTTPRMLASSPLIGS